MRIITWNVNGIKTVPQYHPWTRFKCLNDILNSEELSADIVCMQEMKIPRSALEESQGLPPSFDAFLSFPSTSQEANASQTQLKKTKSGYSGTGVYTRTEGGSVVCTPIRAEASLCFPPRDDAERISQEDSAYPALMPFIPPLRVALNPHSDEEEEGDVKVEEDTSPSALDSEGRSIILDFGLFVLVNVYCPNDASGRTAYKWAYHAALQARVAALIHEGREVMVVGDLNATPFPIDHCEGALDVKREGLDAWYKGPSNSGARSWLRDWLLPLPLPAASVPDKLVDVTRMFHPQREAMYTCWNTKLSARESNYGTRIDFILATKGLLPWIKYADIMPDIRGSDHCPVFVELHESVSVSSDGDNTRTVLLQDVFGSTSDPPRLATRFWDEYSRKQMRLDSFFGGKSKNKSQSAGASFSDKTGSAGGEEPSAKRRKIDVEANRDTSSSRHSSRELEAPYGASTSVSSTNTRVDRVSPRIGQTKIANFFNPPPKERSSFAKGKRKSPSLDTGDATDVDAVDANLSQQEAIDADYRFALQLSQSSEASSSKSSSQDTRGKEAWSKLLAPLETPLCTVHGEPCKKMTVNKKGPNKGKAFWICSRSVGPGYDRGKSSRPRDEVDHQWKCDFFKWCK